MSNSASSNIEDFADLISGHGESTPVNDNLVSLLRSLASMTDSELAAAKITTKVTVWDSTKHGLTEALQLPEGGSLYKCYGMGWIEGSVTNLDLTDSITELKKNSNGSSWQATTQTEICRKAFPSIYK